MPGRWKARKCSTGASVFSKPIVFTKRRNQHLATRIYKGASEEVPLGLGPGPLRHGTARQQYEQLAARTDIDYNLTAPIDLGTRVGEVVVELQGEVVAREPLVALTPVGEGGIWRRAVDTVLMMLE
jgi:serine-type D-Ala-D-Ala carboxypeptidase (penicillin-binding protein 5/6)